MKLKYELLEAAVAATEAATEGPGRGNAERVFVYLLGTFGLSLFLSLVLVGWATRFAWYHVQKPKDTSLMSLRDDDLAVKSVKLRYWLIVVAMSPFVALWICLNFTSLIEALCIYHYLIMPLLPVAYYSVWTMIDARVGKLIVISATPSPKTVKTAGYYRGFFLGSPLILLFPVVYSMWHCGDLYKGDMCVDMWGKWKTHPSAEALGLWFPAKVILAIYFCIVTPILEEVFWREFMYKELSFTYGVEAAGAPDGEDDEEDATACVTIGKLFTVDCSGAKASSFVPIIAVAFFSAASISWFMMILLPKIYAMATTFCVFLFNVVLQRVRNTPGWGLLGAIGLHTALNLAWVFCILLDIMQFGSS